MNDSEYPSLGNQIQNLGQFSFNVIKNALDPNVPDHIFASEEIQNQRLEICKSCEYYDHRQIRCRHCGCFLKSKVRFSIDSCPLLKWSKHEVRNIPEHISESSNTFSESMTSLGFPSNPEVGDIHQRIKEDGVQITWQYDGNVWRIID